MRAMVLGLVAAFGLGFGAGLRAEEPADGIRGVIGAQIEAFKADDFARAFSFASPSIRGMFGDPDNFGRMVRSGYPMVWRPAQVIWGELTGQGAMRTQSVVLRDATGALYVADYDMIELDGAWVINGVRIRPAPSEGV